MMDTGLKCGFLQEQDCLKAGCPLRAWVEDENGAICIFDIAAITIKRVISGTEKLAHVVKGMSREQLIQKGVDIWKKIR